MVFVFTTAVGAAGIPVKVGLAVGALAPTAVLSVPRSASISLTAATKFVFAVVVSADKSAALPLSNVRNDLHSVAIRVARSVIRDAKVAIIIP